MVVDTRRHSDDTDLRNLEALWQTPAVEPRSTARPLTLWLGEHGWRLLTIAWPVVLVSLLVAPTSEDAAPVPWYGWTLLGLFWGALGAMLVASLGRFGSPLKCSLAAASLGVALGVGCVTTGHHPSGVAIYELVAFSGLFLLSAGTLAAARGSR